MKKIIYNIINNTTKCIPDKLYIQLMYYRYFNKFVNFKSPKTFNEKLQWLKLYDRDPQHIDMVDKCEAKRYVEERIGKEYIIPTYGVWESFDDIDFDSLPEQFVLKCTHDSGGVVICKNKSDFDIEAARSKINKSLKHNYYYHGREWPYKNLKPRIIAEQYMEDTKTAELRDYKFFCFDGEVKCFKVDYDRFKNHRANYYTPQGELMRFGETVCPPDFEREVNPPKTLDKMISFANRLSAGHPFLRVDFYEVDDRVLFGELTFYPAAGFGPFSPEEWDFTLGEWIKLPDKKE